jgi:two-component system response regulator AtoC
MLLCFLVSLPVRSFWSYNISTMDQIETCVTADPVANGFVYGLGPAVLTSNAIAAEIARTDIPVLIVGESGTGKDVYAGLIHRLSRKSDAHLRKINCAAVDPGDLFAQVHETVGQCSTHEALGSVYLDNIQELDLACQCVLLAHLPDGEITGSRDALCARLISSTTRDLESEVETGRFRRELYFRLNAACLRLPPLRERTEDIPALTEYFLNKHSSALKKKAPPLSNKAIQTLTAYHWPGNIRELENLARKIVVFGDVQIALNDLQTATIVTHRIDVVAKGASLKMAARAASKQAERQLIMQALERTRWNRKRSAYELQISYKSLLYKIKQLEAFHGDRES